MKNKGIGTLTDLIIFSLIVSIACLILIGNSAYQEENGTYSKYANRVAQNTLLALQNIKTGEIGNFSYNIDISFIRGPEERVLRKKSLNQLICEDIILNPKIIKENIIIRYKNNYEYDEKLNKFLEGFLEDFIGNKFGFKLTIELEKTKISKNIFLAYKKSVVNIDPRAKKLCTESISTDLLIPKKWIRRITGIKENRSRNPNTTYSQKDYFTTTNPSNFPKNQLIPLEFNLEIWSK